MPFTIKSPLTSLRGWLWLLWLCLVLGPTPVADPSSFQTLRPTRVQQDRMTPGTPTLGVPHPPLASFDGPTKPPPISYSPRVTLCWDPLCKTAVSARGEVANPAKSGLPFMRAPITRLVSASLSRALRNVRRAVSKLARPPPEQSLGLLTLRTGGKISVPPIAWVIEHRLPTLFPTPTYPEQTVPTRTTGASTPAAPTTSRKWHRGSAIQHSTYDLMSRVLWILALGSSVALGVYRVCVARSQAGSQLGGHAPVSELPLVLDTLPAAVYSPAAVDSPLPAVDYPLPVVDSQHFVAELPPPVAEPNSPPLTSFDWAIACEALPPGVPCQFLELIDRVDVKVQLGIHLAIPGQRRQLLLYRSDGSFFERYRTEYDLEELMDWAFSEAQFAVNEWYPEVRELGATMEIRVLVTTTALVAECHDGRHAYISRVDRNQYSFCICVELPSDAPVAPVSPSEDIIDTELAHILHPAVEAIESTLPIDLIRTPTPTTDNYLSDLPPNSFPPIPPGYRDLPTSSPLLIEWRPASHHDQTLEVTGKQGPAPPLLDTVLPLENRLASVLRPPPLVEWPIASSIDQATEAHETRVATPEPSPTSIAPVLPPHSRADSKAESHVNLEQVVYGIDPGLEVAETPGPTPSLLEIVVPLRNRLASVLRPPPLVEWTTASTFDQVTVAHKTPAATPESSPTSIVPVQPPPTTRPIRADFKVDSLMRLERLVYELAQAMSLGKPGLNTRKAIWRERRLKMGGRSHRRTEEEKEEMREMKRVLAARTRGEMEVFRGRGKNVWGY